MEGAESIAITTFAIAAIAAIIASVVTPFAAVAAIAAIAAIAAVLDLKNDALVDTEPLQQRHHIHVPLGCCYS